MIDKKFSLGKVCRKRFDKLPNFRFRDQSDLIHNASEATQCGRAITYKRLGYKETNPTDYLGEWRMKFGNWIERGILYDVFAKMNLFGINLLGTQGQAGEFGTFYGTTWHGYRDIDIAIKDKNGERKAIIVELKTKVGFGAGMTIHPTPWAKTKFIIPEPDQEWGYSQQIGLYLRNAYHTTQKDPNFKNPIKDGILLYFLYADGLCGLVEFYCEYLPDQDAVHFYRVHCEEYPECSSDLDLTIPLKPIADRWKALDDYIDKKELAPPDYQLKYDINSMTFKESTKTDITRASKNDKILGDKRCMYCKFKNQCAKDQGIDLNYSKSELQSIKKYLRML